jgi:hypothetical protein
METPAMTRDPRSIEIVARVAPDGTDQPDLYYEGSDRADRPSRIGHEEYRRYVSETWHQRGQECTGFALAAVVNYLTRKQLDDESAPSVSRRMLYEMAQRYDGNTGKSWEETSTLRGALKGWSRTGAALDELWPYHPHDEDNSVHGTLTLQRLLDGRARPLRSYRKIRDNQIEAMKGALADGHVLYVSARLHPGWYRLFLRDDDTQPVISILPGEDALGGHAFVIVGYDDAQAAFWVHNSWGPEWGVEGYALLPYSDWEVRGQDAWVVDLEPPVSRESRPPARSSAPTDAETVTYREMWPHLVVLRDDGKLASDGLYEMDAGSVATLLFLFQEATIDWERRRLAIVVDGGYLPTAETIERQRSVRDRLMGEEIYPIFVVWETSWWSDLEDELTDWIERFTTSSDGVDVERAAIDRSVAGLIWYEIIRRSSAACASPGGGARLLAEAITTKRKQEPTPRRGPFDLHLVSHGAGDLLATELAGLLPHPLSAAIAIAPATPVATFARAYGALLAGGQLDHLTVMNLDGEAEDADRVGPIDRSFLRVIPDLRIDPGEAASLWRPVVGPAMGVGDRNEADEEIGAQGGAGRFARVSVSNSSHLDLVWDRAVHTSLVDTLRSHESSFVRPQPGPSDPLARAIAALRER